MPNLRLIHDNAADRATSLAASTTSGALVAANLQNDFKGQVHRSTGTSVILKPTYSGRLISTWPACTSASCAEPTASSASPSRCVMPITT